MYVQRVDDERIPKMNHPCGYDLLIGDWVKPYGQGQVSDFIINIEFYINNNKKSKNQYGSLEPIYDKKLTITFSNPNDGIQKVTIKKEKKTGYRSIIKCPFKFIYEAPLDGYKNIFTKHDFFDGKKEIRTYDNNANYVFRIRTKTNKKGKIISALYGKIYGQIEHGKYIQFTYYVNPTPNSRSME